MQTMVDLGLLEDLAQLCTESKFLKTTRTSMLRVMSDSDSIIQSNFS